jgi:hypothetical protein
MINQSEIRKLKPPLDVLISVKTAIAMNLKDSHQKKTTNTGY